jgi:ABC-2 type transport system ATP-binding protein
MVYTTHYMEEAEALCSYVAIMDAGQIIIEGAPAELLHRFPDCVDLEALFIKLTGKQLRD